MEGDQTEQQMLSACAGCHAQLAGEVVQGEVLYVDHIVTIFSGKVSRSTVARWLAGPLLSGQEAPGIRGRWITVSAFEADLGKVGCPMRLATACPGCGTALNGYLVRGEVVDAQDIVDFFSGRISLETAQLWFKRKLLRGRKTPGIRGYWTSAAEFHEDVRLLRGSPRAKVGRVVAHA